LVPDSLIKVENKDLKDYYNKNKGKYRVLQANKKIIYGVYRIDPSTEDEAETVAWAQETQKLFGEEKNDELFVKTESETALDEKYYKKGSGLASELDTVLFGREKGFVYGPYVSYRDANKTYNVAKIIDVQMMPDSAKVSQVLMTPEKMITALTKNNTKKPSQEEVVALWKNFDAKVDSVYNALNKDASAFAIAAFRLSDDTASSKKGGDLGWIQEKSTQYPPQFLDSVFMENKSGTFVKKVKVTIQNGQYYYYQLVKVDQMGPKSKKLKVGVVSKSVLPGNKTRDDYFNKINQVAIELNNGKKLKELKTKFNFLIDSAVVEPSQFVVNDLKGGRQLVYWAFNEAEKSESKVFDLDRKYIVAFVSESNDKGFKNWDDVSVKSELEMKVKNIKKAEYIANKLGAIDAKKLMSIATIFPGATVESFPDVNLKSGIVKLAYESTLNGAVAGLAKGKTSQLIAGFNATYIVKTDAENLAKVDAKTNFDLEKQEINSKNNKFELLMQELITEKANVTDNRKILQ
jgi:peptidyl-prolyl cis-trans isomerase D